MLKLTIEALKKLPLAGVIDYAFKLGKEREKNPNDPKLKSAVDAVRETVPAKVYKRFMDAYNAGSKAGGGMMEMRKKGMGLRMKDGGATFPDLSGDGKITQKDILMGRGVIRKKAGGMVKKRAKSKSKKSRGMGIAKRGGNFKGSF
jgi:hypothetical protein|tara:strand:- start:231 stop:668 length:438 start_codon:yes stop_codon:yes gene_type:complete